MTLAPLDDPTYAPAHPPVNGRVPEIVAKWAAASQLRWFARFSGELTPALAADWEPFHCSSDAHRGVCCASCLSDEEDGYWDGPTCCCKALS